ncbi:MAG: NAD(P)-dependent alcohol dehydrogenase [Gemmatimonadota bacterium]|nr:NAD(P)-dependent alcohol dehydrogenase [Gemmatimonadota bacterium]
MPVAAFAGFSADTPLKPHTIDRRLPGPTDVAIEILFCGVCHSDLHTVRSEWGPATYPCVPGHEIVGRVTALGGDVAGFAKGQLVAVGCLVDSCRSCGSCEQDLEQYCEGGFTGTYNSPDAHLGGVTYGGYSTAITVDQRFVLRIPENLDPAAAAPLLCAGVTTWSPLRHWGAGPGSKVGIVGLGGLGHMGVKLAAALGAEVTLFTTSAGKADDARRLGATHVVLTTDAAQVAAHARQLDLILNTVSVPHDLDLYMGTLARDGVMVLLGVPPTPHPPVGVLDLVLGRRRLAGSLIGGLRETQELLDFCGEHGIVSEIELIPMQEINTAYERMLRSDVRYRFVIDMGSLKGEGRSEK